MVRARVGVGVGVGLGLGLGFLLGSVVGLERGGIRRPVDLGVQKAEQPHLVGVRVRF